MNIELLEKVKKNILAEPDRVDMMVWCSKDTCGTIGCIAGHVLYALGIPYRVMNFEGEFSVNPARIAAAALELPEGEADYLFMFHNASPSNPYYELSIRLKKWGRRTKRYAKVVADAIDLCIERHLNAKY